MEAVGRLAGGVAHDFNTLLPRFWVIPSCCGAAWTRTRKRGTTRRGAAARERASELTNQLLAFSRRQPAAPQAVDLNQVSCKSTRCCAASSRRRRTGSPAGG